MRPTKNDNRMPKKRRSLGIPTLALVITLVLQLYVPGAALCLEDGGNAFVEEYSSGFCADSFADSHTGVPSPTALGGENYPGEGHCGSCRDIPLAESIGRRDTHSASDAAADTHPQILAAYVLPGAFYLISPERAPFTESTHVRTAFPVFIHSTILIC